MSNFLKKVHSRVTSKKKSTELEISRVTEQVDMLLNLQSNMSARKENVLELFDTFNTVLANHGSSKDFQHSLEKSKKNYADPSKLLNKISVLQQNNSDSFLICPLKTKEHAFSGVLRKFTDDRGAEKFSLLVTNLLAGSHKPYEEYIFNDKNKLFKAITAELDANGNYLKTDELYDIIEKNASEKYFLAFDSREQYTGNCYLKELEKGIKAALIPFSEVKKARLGSLSLKPVKFVIHGKQVSTSKIHEDYIEVLKSKYPQMQEVLDERKKSISVNKNVRQWMEGKEDIKYTPQEVVHYMDNKTLESITETGNRSILDKKAYDFFASDKKIDLDKIQDMTYYSYLLSESVISLELVKNIQNTELEKISPILINQLKKDASCILTDEALMDYTDIKDSSDYLNVDKANEKANLAIELYPFNAAALAFKKVHAAKYANYESFHKASNILDSIQLEPRDASRSLKIYRLESIYLKLQEVINICKNNDGKTSENDKNELQKAFLNNFLQVEDLNIKSPYVLNSINMTPGDGLIHLAVKNNLLEFVNQIINITKEDKSKSQGLLDFQDKNGNTAMHLLVKGIRTDLKNHNISKACHKVETLKLINEAGANFRIRNHENNLKNIKKVRDNFGKTVPGLIRDIVNDKNLDAKEFSPIISELNKQLNDMDKKTRIASGIEMSVNGNNMNTKQYDCK